MLNIILGDKNSKLFLNNHKFVNYNDGLFDDEYREEWFEDKFIQKVLQTIDHINLNKSTGTSFTNTVTGNTHSQIELSTGCKTLILMYKFPEVIFQARFGDNCTDFVEQLATTSDITIKSDYLHMFNFKYIKEINYINYGVVAKSKKDINDLLQRFRDDNVDDISTNTNIETMTIDEMQVQYPFFMQDVSSILKEY